MTQRTLHVYCAGKFTPTPGGHDYRPMAEWENPKGTTPNHPTQQDEAVVWGFTEFGKVGSADWRAQLTQKLAEKTGWHIINLDPARAEGGFDRNENDAQLIFGRECFMISRADLVIVNLTDDISVGGSQEMLIAKYFRKPLIGLAMKGGKFYKEKTVILGKTYRDHIHPFVKMTCDAIVEDLDGVAQYLVTRFEKAQPKDIGILNGSIAYYQRGFFHRDPYLHHVPVRKVLAYAQKGVILDEYGTSLLAIRFRNDHDVAHKVRGRLGLPGGRLAFGETLREGFIRQIREETGVTATPAQSLHTWGWAFQRFRTQYQIVATAWSGRYRGGNIRTSVVHDETDLASAVWVPLRRLRLADFPADEQPVLRKALR